MNAHHYVYWTFNPQCTQASHDDGRWVRFSPKEAAVLRRLQQAKGQLVSRDALLADHVTLTSKALDLLIARLRQRLEDNARNPVYIATRYGEGYAWVALRKEAPSRTTPQRQADFLAIGPLYGSPDALRQARTLLAQLGQRIRSMARWPGSITIAPDWPGLHDTPAPRYAMTCSLYLESGVLHGAFALQHVASQRVVLTFRLRHAQHGDANDADVLTQPLQQIQSALWLDMSLAESGKVLPQEPPAEVRLHEAGKALAPQTADAWKHNDHHLRLAMVNHAADQATLALSQAMVHFDRIVHQPHQQAWLSADEWDRLDDDIEQAVQRVLPSIQDNAVLMLAVAKLLIYLGPRHLPHAAELSRTAFDHSTAFAAAFTTMGQLRMCEGDIAHAIQLFDNGLQLYEPGSQPYLYALTLKLIALLADGRHDTLQPLLATLSAHDPAKGLRMRLMMVRPDADPPADLAVFLHATGPQATQRTLHYMYRLTARTFLQQAHQRNILLGLATHAQRQWGDPAIPADLAWVLGN